MNTFCLIKTNDLIDRLMDRLIFWGFFIFIFFILQTKLHILQKMPLEIIRAVEGIIESYMSNSPFNLKPIVTQNSESFLSKTALYPHMFPLIREENLIRVETNLS